MTGGPQDDPGRDPGRRHLAVAAAVWAALTLAGEALVQLVIADSFPFLASREGAISDDAILALFRFVVPVFTLVVVVLGYAMLGFRVREGDVRDSVSQPRTHRGYTWTWLGATSALAIAVTVHPGVTGLLEIWEARGAEDPLVVNVTAQQWEWRFTYPEHGRKDEPTLVLPVNRPVRFVLRSEDVIHSFWVPAFRLKEDVVPGSTRTLTLTPNRVGTTRTSPMLRVQCAELCGIGHADMAAVVRVVTPAEFRQWVGEQAAGASPRGEQHQGEQEEQGEHGEQQGHGE